MAGGETMTWIQTYTCHRFDLANPRAEDVDILDIAHALSLQCRFNGHCRRFYSVAQHSVLVSRLVPKEHAFPALMHDSPEAYVSDVPSPLKRAPFMADYGQCEHGVMGAIAERFGFSVPLDESVKTADLLALATEARDLMGVCDPKERWGLPCYPHYEYIHPLTPEQAEAAFLERFIELRAAVAAQTSGRVAV
jgi:5'-deoxynucleotidase YfbR-like HD superfamily hydrolase